MGDSTLFGMTTLGADPIKELTASEYQYCFHLIPESHYIETFNKYLLGSNSQIAKTLEIDGDAAVLRASLGDMLRELVGRQPRKFELEAWFTCLDFDRSAILGLEEFLQSVQSLIEFSGNPENGKTYTSFNKYHADWVTNRRVGTTQQKTNRAPMTAAQEIGWHVLKPQPKDRPYFGSSSTDVTKSEGRSKASYFGMYM